MKERLKSWWRKKWALIRIRSYQKRALAQRRAETRRDLFLALVGAGVLSATYSTPAHADTAFSAFAFAGSGSPTSRTTPARIADIYNVMEFGAVGTGTPTPLSTRYGSVPAAQAVYPFVTSLTEEIDGCAIQLAVNTSFANVVKGGTVFLPHGNYLASNPINIGTSVSGSNGTSGRIIGSGRFNSYINGTINNDFIFYQDSGTNGVGNISNFSLVNSSTWIGSGALRFYNSSMVIDNMNFGGMINVLMPYDIYDAAINNCSGGAGSDATTGYNGTLGIAGYAPHIKNWRSTNPYMAAFQLWGSNTCHIDGCGIENSVCGVLLGMQAGWSSSVTFAPDASTGFSAMTVAGKTGSGAGGIEEFTIGRTVFGRGLNLPAWGSDPNDTTGAVIITGDGVPTVTDNTTTVSGTTMTVNGISSQGNGLVVGAVVEGTGVSAGTTIASLGSGTGGAGTYILSASQGTLSGRTITATGAANGTKLTGVGWQGTYRVNGTYTISTPVPVWTRASQSITGVSVGCVQTEACFHAVYLNQVSACNIQSAGGGANPIECPNQFGVTGLTQRASLYINDASSTKISGYTAGAAATQLGGIYMVRTQGVSLDSCYSQKGTDNTVTATISNGSGGAGTILNVTAVASGISIGVGMVITDAGTPVAIVTGNHLTNPSRSGTNTTGTYDVDTSLNLSSRTLVIHTGADIVLPTANSSKAGVRVSNYSCILPAGISSGLNDFNMTFSGLPGQADWAGYVALVVGMSFFITDAQKNGGGTAAPGDPVSGGGSQKIPVFYDNDTSGGKTGWRYGGAGQFS